MPMYMGRRSQHNVGDISVPADVRRRRRQVEEMMHRMGTPVVHKHRYNDLDTKSTQFGSAIRVQDLPEIVSQEIADIYDQVRNWDPLSYGVGYVGAENGAPILSSDEFYDLNWTGFNKDTPNPNDLDDNFIWRIGVDGNASEAAAKVDAGELVPAPKYRGYGPATLIYVIMPDRAEDYYKANVGGPLFKVQEAYAIAPWYPEVNDNDLMIPVQLDPRGNIVRLDGYGRLPVDQQHDRFEAKMANQVSMRGLDRSGRRERGGTDTWGNRHIVNQTFEMALLPWNDIAYRVEVDR
jgi:hypothetical protein